MNIRLATKNDSDIIQDFGNKVLIHHQAFDNFYHPIVSDKELIQPEKLTLLAVDDNQRPVAYIQGIFQLAPNDRSVPHATIQSIWVEADIRGQGLAQQLVGEFENIAKEKGIKQIDLFIDTRNHLGLELWNKTGYVIYQERRRKLL